MTKKAERAAIYGLVNGLGYAGDPETKSRLVQSAQRAANRGDWGSLIEMGAAYLVGAAVGSSLRNPRQAPTSPQKWW
jgi:hypothetical protein